MNGAFSYPQVITSGDTGVSSVVNRMNIQFTAVIPLGMADTDVNEAVSQGLNLLAASLMKSAFKAGYAPV